MSDALANQLDLRLAWRRVKSDLKHRVFITHPYELLLIESDLDGWLAELDGLIRSGHYHPGPMLISEVPKGRGLIRPGSHLLLIDLVVYTACVGACFSRIHEVLRWSQGAIDFAYRLSVDPQQPEWLRSQFTGWQDFRQASLERLKASSYAIFSDISAYYENIDISTLISDLKSTGAPEEPIKVISACLNRWAQVQGRGIPQGNSASDLLAKLYLNVVDLNLLAMGFEHLRYVDDVRIFVSTHVEAKKALVALVQLLRGRGLNVQSAKTEILTASEGAQDLEHVIHAVTEVGRRLVEKIKELFGVDNPYISIPEVDKILSDNPDDAPVHILEEAYNEFFADPGSKDFDPTLFRFLLGRLAQVKSGAPLMYEFTQHLAHHPEETETVLAYIEQLDQQGAVENDIVTFLESGDSVYPYQIYQLMNWLGRVLVIPSNHTIALARRMAFDRTQPSYVRAVSQKILGDHGTVADLERLQGLYAEAGSPLQQSELICSLHRMEMGRRNAILARMEQDGPLQQRAVRLVRAGRIERG